MVQFFLYKFKMELLKAILPWQWTCMMDYSFINVRNWLMQLSHFFFFGWFLRCNYLNKHFNCYPGSIRHRRSYLANFHSRSTFKFCHVLIVSKSEPPILNFPRQFDVPNIYGLFYQLMTQLQGFKVRERNKEGIARASLWGKIVRC